MPPHAAATRCRQTLPPHGAATRCRRTVLPRVATSRCRHTLLPHGAATRCRRTVPPPAVAARCRHTLPPRACVAAPPVDAGPGAAVATASALSHFLPSIARCRHTLPPHTVATRYRHMQSQLSSVEGDGFGSHVAPRAVQGDLRHTSSIAGTGIQPAQVFGGHSCPWYSNRDAAAANPGTI